MMVNKGPLFLLEEELTFKLRGIFIEVSRNYGYSYKEKVYQNILSKKFKVHKINFAQYPIVSVMDIEDGDQIDKYIPDFLVENKIIIEIKAQRYVASSHIDQLVKYLHSTKYEIGFLVNFGSPKVEIIRRIYTNDRKSFLFKINTDSALKDTDGTRIAH